EKESTLDKAGADVTRSCSGIRLGAGERAVFKNKTHLSKFHAQNARAKGAPQRKSALAPALLKEVQP
ncbi:MAG: hypothetical protein EBS01_14390, partial [Verrucomicrobia bacterium]|nr:hypothetical protein [Verrucomicrobiota bacterium]